MTDELATPGLWPNPAYGFVAVKAMNPSTNLVQVLVLDLHRVESFGSDMFDVITNGERVVRALTCVRMHTGAEWVLLVPRDEFERVHAREIAKWKGPQ